VANLKNVSVKCVEQDDSKEFVWHEVYATIEGKRYVRRIEARDPKEAVELLKDKQIVLGWNWKEVI
jgi:hypothetical protein